MKWTQTLGLIGLAIGIVSGPSLAGPDDRPDEKPRKKSALALERDAALQKVRAANKRMKDESVDPEVAARDYEKAQAEYDNINYRIKMDAFDRKARQIREEENAWIRQQSKEPGLPTRAGPPGPPSEKHRGEASVGVQAGDGAKDPRARLKTLLGDLPPGEEVKGELVSHAWRMARLRRIRVVAHSMGDTALVLRADNLLEREQKRHDEQLALMTRKESDR